MSDSTTDTASKGEHGFHRYTEPLSPITKRVLLASVIFFHVGAGYALTQIEPPKIIVSDAAPLEVSFVTPDAPAEKEIPPPPEEPPPPDIPPPPVEAMIAPPDPDLPPPEFPVEIKPPEPPKPPPPKPVPPKVVQQPRPPSPSPPAEAQASSAPVAPRAAGPQTLTASQVGVLTPASPIYPMRSKRNGDQGTVMVKVLIDTSGRPTQVTLQTSSGHAELDEAAISGVRAARFRPVADPVWVLYPIKFALQ